MSVTSVAESRLGMSGRIYSLDGLRGVAALSVLVHHSIIVPYPQMRAIYSAEHPIEPVGSLLWWFTHTPLHVPWLGAEAVFTFFILSGLVLTRPVLGARPFSWLSYYPKRLVRLYLPVWGSLALVVAVTLMVAAAGVPTSQEWADTNAAKFTPSNLIRDAVVLMGLTPLNGVLWSLRWEILFSLLLPLYIIFAATKRVPWQAKVAVVVLAVILSRTLLIDHRLFGELFFYMPMFALGAIMAAEFERMEELANRISSPGWAVLCGITALLLSAYWLTLAFTPPIVLLDVSPAISFLRAGALVFIAAFNPQARRFLGMRQVQWLGLISFSLYLIHAVLLEAVNAVLPAGSEPLVMVVGIPLSLAAATLFYRFIEKPSTDLAKRVQVGLPGKGARRPNHLA